MNIYSFASLSASIFCFILGIFVISKRYKDRKCKSFGIASILTGVWTLLPFALSLSKNKELALFLARLIYIPAVLVAPTWLYFVFTAVREKLSKNQKLILILSYSFGGIFLFFSFSPLFIKGTIQFAPFFAVIPGKLYFYFVAGFAIIFTYIIKTICDNLKVSVSYYKNQLIFILLSFILGFLSGVLHFTAAFFRIEPFPHDFLLIGYTGLIAYAIIKHHLMDIKVAITRAGIFAFVYSLVLGIPFIIGYLTKSWLIPTGVMFFLATVGPLIYTRLRKKAEDLILAEQKKYQRILLQAAQGMVKIRDLKHLINLIVHIITKTVRVDRAAVFRLNKEKNLYQLEAYRDRELFKREKPLSFDHPLIKHLLATKEPLLLEDIPLVVKDRLSQKEISSFFKEYNFHLIVPSFTETILLGFLALGSKPNHQVFTPEDINVFKILAHQASLAIENCQFIEEFQKTQEKVFRADKLATIGAMAEGVSHQMNNRLQVFSAIAGDLKDLLASILKNDPNLDGKLKEDLDYLLHGLDKMEKNVIHSAQIIRGILNYARTEKDKAFRFLDLREIIDIALDLLGVKHSLKDFKPTLNISESLPKVYGSPAQLSEALFNLIDNAYEALEEKKSYLQLKETSSSEFKKELLIEAKPLGDRILLEIKDTGIGIKEENKPKIFAPFYTTKSSANSGTGLGMYVVKRIIEENHKGKIWFESKYLQGTTFYVELPCRRV